jgi:hypothetical protein|tara:strand:+ start:356 stop:757 length:402 start_codon:yes stop_codon:yes gene_type:complete
MKVLLTTILVIYAFFSTFAQAEWRYFEESYDGDILSIDFDSAEIQDKYITYWQLIDLKSKPNGVASAAEYIKLNCDRKVKTYQRLQVIAYAKSGGNAPTSNQKVVDPVWMRAAPESIYEITFERLCEAMELLR